MAALRTMTDSGLEGFAARVVECYKEYLKENLVSIVLFGSRAREEEKITSDYDLLLIAEKLPVRPLQRVRYVRRPLVGKIEEKIGIIAKTRGEIDRGFPPLYLDIGLDGIILYDRGFMADRIDRIRAIITQAGLERVRDEGGLRWKWKRRPSGGWSIDWSGYREF